MVGNPENLANEIENYDLTDVEDCNKLIEKYNFQFAASLKDVWVLKRMLQLINEKHLDVEILNEINKEAVEDLTKLIQGDFSDE